MTQYFDLSELGGCVGIFVSPGDRVVYTGVQLHTEPAKYRGCELAERFARENDLNFWFEGEKPDAAFYAVPQIEIGGYDSRGGLFAGGPGFTLSQAEPLYYIDREHRCFLMTDDSRAFSGMGLAWRERMVPTDAIEVFPSLAAAMERYTIHKPRDHEDLLKLLKGMDDAREGEA